MIDSGDHLMATDTKLHMKQLTYLLLITQFVWLMSQAGNTKYAIALGLSAVLLVFGKDKIDRKNAFLLLPGAIYVCLGLVSCASSGFFDFYTVKTGFLVTVSAFSTLILYEKGIDRNVEISKVVFLAYALFSISRFSYSPPSFIIESTRAFPYGAFVIYFFIMKDWRFCALAAVFCTISHKRIALLGVVVVLCLVISAMLLIQFFRLKMKSLWIVGGVIGVLTAYVIAGMTHTGGLVELFDVIGFDPMGRQTIWKVARQFGSFNLFFTGNGLGFVMSRLEEMKVWMRDDLWFRNLHSDFYTGFLELGFIGFGAWVFSYFLSFNRLSQTPENDAKPQLFALAVIVYTFVLYVTDNVLIYFEYWFPLSMMLIEIADKNLSKMKKQVLLNTSQHFLD